MNIKIYTVTHKKYRFPNDSIYVPIIAGAFAYTEDCLPAAYIRDNTLDNISDKHDLYSEFTAVYWAWMNSDAEIVGINHYRRYFIRDGWLNYLKCLTDPMKKMNKYILNKKDITDFFNDGYECIVPKKQWRVNRTLKEEFVVSHGTELINRVEIIIKKLCPAYYDTFQRVMASKENYYKCLCIMTKEKYREYAKWLFDIFNQLEEEGFGGTNREFAFLGERLINVWIGYQRDNYLKIKELFFINVEFSFKGIIKNHSELFIPRWIRRFLKALSKFGFEVVVGHGHCKIQRKIR